MTLPGTPSTEWETASADSAVRARAAPQRPVDVAVIIVTYRSAPLTIACLRSLQVERSNPALRIRAVVVDNASGDLTQISSAVNDNHWSSWVTVVGAPKNGGFAYGNNLGIEVACAAGTPSYLYLLNPDTEVRPGAIAGLVKFLETHSEAGIAGSSFETGAGSDWKIAFRFPTLLGELEQGLELGVATRLLGRWSVVRRMGERCERVDWISGSSMMIRPGVFAAIGGLDENYFLFYEETDLCRRARAAGFTTWYVPESRVMHIGGATTSVSSRTRTRFPPYWFESRRRYFAVTYGLAHAMLIDLVAIGAHLLGTTKRRLQGRQYESRPSFIRDLLRHSVLWRRNRDIPPIRSRLASSTGTVNSGVASSSTDSRPPESPRNDWLLAARPHLRLRGDVLVSVGLPDPGRQLSAAEVQLWNLMQPSVSVQTALESCGPDADHLIRRFVQEGVCELVEPAFPAHRPRVLIIEPHADDAVLSLGGTLWLRRHECAFVIATMASRSNHTRYRDLGANHDVESVTEMRRREAELAARTLGGEHVSVGLTDAALRYHDGEWSRDFYRRHQLSINASTARVADAAELRRWTDALQRLVTEQQPAEIWFPLGGPHADHMLTADACLAAFTGDPSLVRGRQLRIYTEVPYAVRSPQHMNAALAAVRRAGVVLEEECTAIAPLLAAKRRLASIYDSQSMAELFAAGGDLPESFWTVRELPRQPPPVGLVSRAISDDAPVIRALAAWVARNRDAAVVRVLLTAPTGRWQSDLSLLERAFPRARFEVSAATMAEAEVIDAASSRVDAHTVAGGPWAWLRETLRVCRSRPGPVLLHAAGARARQARVLASLCLGSDPQVITSMDRLAGALQIAPDAR